MKLMMNDGAQKEDSRVFLFLTEGSLFEEDKFRILAETEFSDLSYDNFEALEFFIEESNEKLKGM